MERMAEAWINAIGEFPITGTPAAKLRAAIPFAMLAPSMRNSQPWTFHVERDTVLLYADRRRIMRSVDPDGRELTISCGAALFNLRLALRHFGYETLVSLLPGPPALIATLTLDSACEPTEQDHAMFDAISRRHSIRGPFLERPVSPLLVAAMARCAADEGASLVEAASFETRTVLADLTAAALRLQMTSGSYRRELARVLHSSRRPAAEGMPARALGMGALKSLAAPLVVPAVNVGTDFANRIHERALSAPVLAMLGTPGDTGQDWIRAGLALQHALLRGEMEALGASFLNHAIEVPEYRMAVAAALDQRDFPQLLLQLGHGKSERMTGRRRVDEVLV